MWPNLKETADLVTFTEDILNGKLLVCAVLVDTDAYAERILFKHFNPIQGVVEKQKGQLTIFPSNFLINPSNFLTFGFSTFKTVAYFQGYISNISPKLLNLNQYCLSKISVFLVEFL